MFNSAQRCLPLLRGRTAARARLPTRPRVRPLPRPNDSLARSFSTNPTPPDENSPGENPARKPVYVSDGRSAVEVLSHDRHGLVVQKELYHMGTVTVKKPGDTDIRTLVDQIEPLPFLNPDSCAPTAMLLVTPSFASALQPSEPDDPASLRNAPEVVTQAVTRLIQDSLERETTVKGIRVIVAVVDRLPSPEDGSQPSKGREGLAYALWFNDNVARVSWSLDTHVQREDDAACLTLDFYDRFKLTDLKGHPRRPYGESIHRLHLPLANTLFQTGQTSLLYNIYYRLSEIVEPKYGEGAILQNRRTLHAYTINKAKSQRVIWPVAGRYLAHLAKRHPNWDETLHQLHVPLVPLTGPRQVEAGMGNIIRQITGPDGKTAPASHELEKAVSSFFEATGQAPHAMPVWALVCSERTVKYFSSSALSALGKWQPEQFSRNYDYAGLFSHYVSEAWTADHKIFQSAIWNALMVGSAKLHRVLSGGGGWGKKAGLISLDPSKSVQRTVVQVDPSTEESLEAVAEPGSYITFFTSPVSSLDVPKYDHDTSVFGTLPSSIDDIPDTMAEGPPGIDVWPGYFGALSEQGMSLKFVRRDPGNKEHYSQTMVDVPFSLFVTSSRLPGAIPTPTVENAEASTSKVSSEYTEQMPIQSHKRLLVCTCPSLELDIAIRFVSSRADCMKPACSPNDILNSSRPGPFAATARRSLHTRANPTFGTCSVRSFSSTPLSRFPKTKHYLRHRSEGLRRLVPISVRFRKIDLTQIKVREDKAEDFCMTLDKYPHFWKISRWLAEYSQAHLDRRLLPPLRSKKAHAPLIAARQLWQSRLDASKAHMVRLRDGHMRMLQLQVEAWAQYIDQIITAELQRLPHIEPNIRNSVTVRALTDKGSLKNTLFCIKAEERAVAQLPFRAPEVTKVLEDIGHTGALKCKKYEDSIYAIVLKVRKRSRKIKRKMGEFRQSLAMGRSNSERIRKISDIKPGKVLDPAGGSNSEPFDFMAPIRKTPDIKPWKVLGPAEGDIKSTRSSLGPKPQPTIPFEAGRPRTSPRAPTLGSRPYDQVPVAKQHSRRLSYSHRFAAPDPPSSSSSSPSAEEANEDHTIDSLSSSFSRFLEETDLDHTPDLPSFHSPPRDEDANVDHITLLFYQNQFGDIRKYFSRKRRAELKQLQEMADKVAKVRHHEIAYLTEAVGLADVVCIDLLLQCAAFDPDAWARRLERLAAGGGPFVQQRGDMWAAMWHTDNIDDATVQDTIKRLRWRVLRWSRKAKIGDEQVHRRLQYVMEILQEHDSGTGTMKMVNERLVEIIEERLKHERRGWERKKLQNAFHKLRVGEVIYLREAINASERNLKVMSKILSLVKQGTGEERERQRRIMENARQNLDAATREKVNVAWSLASELEILLGKDGSENYARL